MVITFTAGRLASRRRPSWTFLPDLNPFLRLTSGGFFLLACLFQSAQATPMLASTYEDTILATGAKFDGKAMAAAHKTLAFGTLLTVCQYRRCICVVISDRGPFVRGRDLDLTPGAAKSLRFNGLGRVDAFVPIPRPRPASAN